MTQITLIHIARTWVVGSLMVACFLSLTQSSPPLYYYIPDKAGSTILVTRTQHKTPGYHESNATYRCIRSTTRNSSEKKTQRTGQTHRWG
jgi:hypothetical protein